MNNFSHHKIVATVKGAPITCHVFNGLFEGHLYEIRKIDNNYVYLKDALACKREPGHEAVEINFHLITPGLVAGSGYNK